MLLTRLTFTTDALVELIALLLGAGELLLRQLFDLEGPGQRRSQFVCAMALVLPDGTEHVRLGVMPGHLRAAPAGDNGFGYDPLFVADGQQVTTAELDAAAKDAISHRGQAIRALVPVLVEELRRTTGEGRR